MGKYLDTINSPADVKKLGVEQLVELAQEIQRWLDEHPLTFKAPSVKDKVSDLLRPVLIPLLLGLVVIIAVLAALVVMHRGK